MKELMTYEVKTYKIWEARCPEERCPEVFHGSTRLHTIDMVADHHEDAHGVDPARWLKKLQAEA